jgi:hypothetical protein
VPAEVVRERFGGGRAVMARQALASGMVDAIATIDAVVARIATTASAPRRRMVATLALPELLSATADPAEGDPDETDLPSPEETPAPRGFDLAGRLATVQTELADILRFSAERARLRAKEGRPAFPTTTETSLRTLRDGLDALLATDEPATGASTTGADEPPVDVGPTPVARTAPPRPPRFGTPGSWDAYLRGLSR